MQLRAGGTGTSRMRDMHVRHRLTDRRGSVRLVAPPRQREPCRAPGRTLDAHRSFRRRDPIRSQNGQSLSVRSMYPSASDAEEQQWYAPRCPRLHYSLEPSGGVDGFPDQRCVIDVGGDAERSRGPRGIGIITAASGRWRERDHGLATQAGRPTEVTPAVLPDPVGIKR